MFCPKCGNNIPDNVQFCTKCGAAVRSAPGTGGPASPDAPQPSAAEAKTAAAVKEKPPKKKRGKKVLVAAVLIVAVLFLLPKVFGSPDDSPPEEDIPVQEETVAPEPPQEGPAALTPDQSAELLAIVDEVEADLEETFAEYRRLDPITHFDAFDQDGDGYIDDVTAYVGAFKQQVQVLDQFYTKLGEQRSKADTIRISDAKLESAVDEYFSLMNDATAAYLKAGIFYTDYQEFYYDFINERPLEIYYDNLADYSEALSAWLQETRAGYEAISAPSCVENEWEQYGTILEYNASIAGKLAQAIQSNDWLRYYSSRNMTSRYVTVEQNGFKKLIEFINNETAHVGKQGDLASALAEEMHTYMEMTPEERDAYSFENIRIGEINLDYDVVDTIYPSLYSTYNAFVIIKTGCISGTRSIVVEAEIEGFTQKYKETFDLTPSYEAIYIKPPALTGELNLSAAKPAQLKVTISEKDGTLIEAKSFPITLKSKYDFEWYSDEYGNATQDNILCFLTPETKAIIDLKRQAVDQIGKMTGGTIESMWGYQSKFESNYVNTYLQAAGLMSALNEMGVRYVMDPFSISGSNQHISLPEDVLINRSGLCIETSLVIASALQSEGMHAFLVFPPGHAQVAVEVWNSGEHKGEYFLIETTCLENGINNLQHFCDNANALSELQPSTGIITYYGPAEWSDYLENNVTYIIDCDDSQLLGLTPFTN